MKAKQLKEALSKLDDDADVNFHVYYGPSDDTWGVSDVDEDEIFIEEWNKGISIILPTTRYVEYKKRNR